MMVNSILQAMGVTPDALTGYIEQGKKLATEFVGAMTGMNQRVTAIEQQNTEILRILREQLLGHPKQISGDVPEPLVPVVLDHRPPASEVQRETDEVNTEWMKASK
jgi:hypothetical protein